MRFIQSVNLYRYSDSSLGAEQSDLSGNRSQDSIKRNEVLTNSTFYDSELRATEFRSCGIAVVIRGSEAEIKALEKDRRESVGWYQSLHDHCTDGKHNVFTTHLEVNRSKHKSPRMK
jgi:hypothetical protein